MLKFYVCIFLTKNILERTTIMHGISLHFLDTILTTPQEMFKNIREVYGKENKKKIGNYFKYFDYILYTRYLKSIEEK